LTLIRLSPLKKPQMICAHVGLLDFMGIKIEAHLLEITFESRFKNLRETINRVRSELIKKLNSSEIVFEERKVELLMLSRKNFSSGRYEIRAINLKPNPEKKIIGSSLFQVGKPKFSFPAIR